MQDFVCTGVAVTSRCFLVQLCWFEGQQLAGVALGLLLTDPSGGDFHGRCHCGQPGPIHKTSFRGGIACNKIHPGLCYRGESCDSIVTTELNFTFECICFSSEFNLDATDHVQPEDG